MPRAAADRARPALSRRRFELVLAAVTALGFAWRLVFTLVTKGHDDNLFNEGDSFYYSTVSQALSTGHWYVNPFSGAPAADHPPMTVLVLAPTSWLFSNSVLAQRLTMTVIGTLVVLAIGLVGRTIAGPVAGAAAAVVAAINPNLWMNDAVVMSESVSALLIVGVIWAGYRLSRDRSRRWAAIAGAMCGLTVLARAEAGLFLPFMVWPLLLAARHVDLGERFKRVALATACCLVVLVPWGVWNHTRFHDPVLVSTNDGVTLAGANCPQAFHGPLVGGWILDCALKGFRPGLDASQSSTHQRQVAVDYIRGHTGRLPAVLWAREGRVWGWFRPDQAAYANQGEGRPEWATWSGFYAFWALIPVSLLGAVVLRRRHISLVPMGAALATVVVVAGAFYGLVRFRLPFDVATCLLAGAAVAFAAERLSRRSALTSGGRGGPSDRPASGSAAAPGHALPTR